MGYVAFESAGKIIHESHSYFQSRKVMKPVCGVQINLMFTVFFLLHHIVIFNFIFVYLLCIIS
jgi:CRISPR/Cas system-associated endonuclease Cas3-HD